MISSPGFRRSSSRNTWPKMSLCPERITFPGFPGAPLPAFSPTPVLSASQLSPWTTGASTLITGMPMRTMRPVSLSTGTTAVDCTLIRPRRCSGISLSLKLALPTASGAVCPPGSTTAWIRAVGVMVGTLKAWEASSFKLRRMFDPLPNKITTPIRARISTINRIKSILRITLPEPTRSMVFVSVL